MTTVNQISDANITPTLPPKIREAVENVKEGANKSYGTRASTGNPLILND